MALPSGRPCSPSPTRTPAAALGGRPRGRFRLPPSGPAARHLRPTWRLLAACGVGYLALWATGALGVLFVSQWARGHTPPPPGTRALLGVRHFQPVDARVWRGSAPSARGYRRLAELGFSTVVDLRAEDLSAARLSAPERAGLRLVRLPIRDGQTPEPEQLAAFRALVRHTHGPIYLHCGAGVGRTGTVAAGYLVGTGQKTGPRAARENLAVGPPSLEQIYYAWHLSRTDAEQPPLPVVVLSRLVDAPRRVWSYL